MTFSKNSELIFIVKWYIDSIDSYYQYPKLFEKIIQKFLRKLWDIGHNIFFNIGPIKNSVVSLCTIFYVKKVVPAIWWRSGNFQIQFPFLYWHAFTTKIVPQNFPFCMSNTFVSSRQDISVVILEKM